MSWQDVRLVGFALILMLIVHLSARVVYLALQAAP
jgi:hypothetical protein